MFMFTFPLLTTAFDDALQDARLQNKTVQLGLVLKRPSDLSKIKTGQRPFPMVRFLSIPTLRPFRKALWKRLYELECQEEGLSAANDRDLLLALLTKFDDVLVAVGVKKPIKVESLERSA